MPNPFPHNPLPSSPKFSKRTSTTLTINKGQKNKSSWLELRDGSKPVKIAKVNRKESASVIHTIDSNRTDALLGKIYARSDNEESKEHSTPKILKSKCDKRLGDNMH